ncbi:MAG: ATP-dependent DNA ligase [Nitrososphaerota archaeon]|nr:ATP-dependent DNA ligase [Candidatus Bathyarchaeota archaeon]MDW8048956.1 ATP-dependent DNA ligase [Nitrososphaerota archaeon]
MTRFKALTDVCERISATTRRNLAIIIAADFIRTLEPKEVEPAISMMLGRPFPRWDQRELDVSWETLSGIIRNLMGVSWNDFLAAFRETGDIGAASQKLFERGVKARQTVLLESPLSILDVRQVFDAVAEATGSGSREKKERLIEALLARASPIEVKYLVKIIIGEMRTGFSEGLMESAVAKAFSIPLETVQKATMIMGDIGEVAEICRTKGLDALSRIGFKVFRPFRPMLAQTANSLEEALEEHGGKTALEFKLDGARVQIHKSKGRVMIFSRRLTEITGSLPEIVQLIRREIRAEEAIVEGEVIAIGKDGSPLPFQHLMRRFKRIKDVDSVIEKIPVKLFLFDVISVEGQSLIDMPYHERRRRLQEIAGDIPLTEQIVADNVQVAQRFLSESISRGHEGLMAKRLDSPYILGARGKFWLKIKEVLEPLDLVIVAAEYGYGKRHKWLSDYYLAARDEESGEFLTVGKTFKGLTDHEIEEMTQRLKEIALYEDGHKVIVSPKIVVEVAYNEIQESPKYKCGMALRFARITRIRDDKKPEEADTIGKVRSIYLRQFEKKARIQLAGLNGAKHYAGR